MNTYTIYLRLLLIITASLYAADGMPPIQVSKSLSACFVPRSIRVPGDEGYASHLFVQIVHAQTADQHDKDGDKHVVIGSVTTRDVQTLAHRIATELACTPLTKELVAQVRDRLVHEYIQKLRRNSPEDKTLQSLIQFYTDNITIDMHTYKPTELPDYIFPPCLHALAAMHNISMADERHRKLLQGLGRSSRSSYRTTYWKVDKNRIGRYLQEDADTSNDDCLSYTATDSGTEPDTSELEELATSDVDADASCGDRLSDTATDADTPLDMSELDVDE